MRNRREAAIRDGHDERTYWRRIVGMVGTGAVDRREPVRIVDTRRVRAVAISDASVVVTIGCRECPDTMQCAPTRVCERISRTVHRRRHCVNHTHVEVARGTEQRVVGGGAVDVHSLEQIDLRARRRNTSHSFNTLLICCRW